MPDGDTWTDRDLERCGVPVTEVPFVSVGGGLGSFAVVDRLRISGFPAGDIRVLAAEATPYARFRRLLEASQVGPGGRLRSDSAARIDNIWGFPGYALSEAHSRRRPGPVWRVVTEPVLSEYFTPTAGQVYRGVDREAARIGWDTMVSLGWVRALRRGRDCYYVVQGKDGVDGGPGAVAFKARYVHVAVGYSSLRIPDDTVHYRERTGDTRTVVSAYEPHEHVFAGLGGCGGTVLVRGAGITASQEIHRLLGTGDVRVVQLIRDFVDHPEGDPVMGPSRRAAGDGVAYQHFVFPRGAGGGQIHRDLVNLPDAERVAAVARLARATSPRRRAWVRALERTRREGRYCARSGAVVAMEAHDEGVAVTWHDGRGDVRSTTADFVIDATGLVCGVEDDPLLDDLARHGIGATNALGRIEVGEDFVVDRCGGGALFASGPIVLGCAAGPVDSFWGLQYAAAQMCEVLTRNGVTGNLGPWSSLKGWWRWMRGAPER